MNVSLIKFAQSSEMKWCLTFEILRILKYIFLATEVSCFFIDKVASRTASKFFFFFTFDWVLQLPHQSICWYPSSGTAGSNKQSQLPHFCVVQFEFIHSHQGSNTCYAISIVLTWKLRMVVFFYTPSAVNLSAICESMAANGILVDTSEYLKIH